MIISIIMLFTDFVTLSLILLFSIASLRIKNYRISNFYQIIGEYIFFFIHKYVHISIEC